MRLRCDKRITKTKIRTKLRNKIENNLLSIQLILLRTRRIVVLFSLKNIRTLSNNCRKALITS